MKSHIFKLDNGIKVIYQKYKSQNSACIVHFNVGSFWESKGEYGLAHFVEHLMFESTKELSAKELMSALELNGAKIGGATSRESTIFHFKTNTQYLTETLKLFVSMLNSKVITEKEFEREKSVVLQELKRVQDNRVRQNLSNWYKQNMGLNDNIGLEEDIKNMTINDFNNWINKYFICQNMTISICSDKYLWQIKKILNKSFKDFRTGDKQLQINQKNKILENIKYKNHKNIFKEKNNKQTQILINFSLKIENYQNHIKARFLNNILSGGRSSILFQEIRDKYGYCYGISSDLMSFLNKEFNKKTNGPYLRIRTDCEPKYVEDCVKQINNTMKNLDKIITENDLKKVKSRIKGEEYNCMTIANHNIASWNKWGKIFDIDTYYKEMLKVNKKDLIDFIKTNIDQKSVVCLYGLKE